MIFAFGTHQNKHVKFVRDSCRSGDENVWKRAKIIVLRIRNNVTCCEFSTFQPNEINELRESAEIYLIAFCFRFFPTNSNYLQKNIETSSVGVFVHNLHQCRWRSEQTKSENGIKKSTKKWNQVKNANNEMENNAEFIQISCNNFHYVLQ